MTSFLNFIQLNKSIVELLGDVGLSDSESSHRRDVGSALLVHGGVFATHASSLQSELLGFFLQSLLVGAMLGNVRELAQNRLSLTSAHVGGTGGDHSVDGVLGESDSCLLDLGEELVEGSVDCTEVVAMHDRDDPELVFLADPDHFGLVGAEPDASAVGPVGGNS